ncbi:hypothetical protein ABBQ32_011986 [Trebouxia sp. C0010 RCD-2024]
MNGVAIEGSGRPKGSSPQERDLPVNDDSKAHVAVTMSEETGTSGSMAARMLPATLVTTNSWNKFCDWLMSPAFQGSVQVTAGQLVTALWVVIPRLTFANSCLASVFYAVGMVMVCQNGHIGSRLKAMVLIPGAWTVGSVCAGFTISIARQCTGAYTTALCLLTALGMVFFSILRTKSDPGSGILTCLSYCITILGGEFIWPARLMWRQVIVNQLFLGLIAALGCLVGGTLLLPSLATDELREVLADIIQKCGYSISGYASRVFPPEQECSSSQQAEQRSTSTRRALQHHMEFDAEKATDVDYREFLEHGEERDKLEEKQQMHSSKGQPLPSAASIRPLLLKASALLANASLEPPFLLRHRVALAKWKPVLDALDDVVLQTSAMESVLEGQESGPLVSDSEVLAVLGHNVLPVFRLLHAQVAAAAAVLSQNIRMATGHTPPQHVSFEPAWAILEHELAAQIHLSMKHYFAQLKQMEPDNAFRPNTLVRAVLYIATLTTGIMEAVTNVDHAVATALSSRHHPHGPAAPTKSTRKLRVQAAILLPVREALTSLHKSDDHSWHGSKRYLYASTSYNALPTWSKPGNGSSVSAKAVAEPPQERCQKAWQRVQEEMAWTWPLLKFLFGSSSFLVWWAALVHWLPAMCSSRKQFWRTLRMNRYLHYGIKFWFGTSAVMAVILVLSAEVPTIQTWRPLYLILTVIIVCSQKVDTTLTKGVLRLVASVLGGAYGYLIMLGSPIASNPYAILVFTCLFTFVAAQFALTTFKYAVFLMLITTYSVILCQYHPHPPPGFHGSVRILYDRLVDVSIGVVIVLLLDLILPWYVSSASLETLGQAFKDATLLMQRNYDIFYEELKLSCYQPQDQQTELERFSDTLSRGPSGDGGGGVAHDSTSKQQDPETGLGAGLGAGRSSLNRQSSALTWSQRQQLRRDSAAVRSAAASRHVLPQETTGAPGAKNQVELAIQRSSQVPPHTPTPPPGAHQAQQHSHAQRRQPEQQPPQAHQGNLQAATKQQSLHSGLHLQPVGSPRDAQNGQTDWSNGQQQQQPPSDIGGAMLGRLGSQPGSGDQHHSGQCQLPGPSQGVDNQGQKLVQKQGQLPTRSQGAGSGGGGEGGRGDEHEALTRAAGLEQDAEEELRGLSRLEEDALEAKVAGPIGRVQVSLIAEGVLWKRGILVMPPIVHKMVQAMQVLLDRLAAQELMLLQRPVISGRYSGAPFVNMLSGPLDEALRPLFVTLVHMGELVQSILSEEPDSEEGQLPQLEKVIQDVEAHRQQVRQVYLDRQRRYRAALLKADGSSPYMDVRTSDDSVRFLSVFFALSKALDKAVLLARMACDDPWIKQQASQRTWNQYRLWFGR